MNIEVNIKQAAKLIQSSKHTFAFTGAGISVESGIPPFRGEEGLWNKYDPIVLDLSYFHENPKESWTVIKKIFYDFFGDAKFNRAHEVLAKLESNGLLKEVVTQNIDNLHQEAGSKIVHEFHGTMKTLKCIKCNSTVEAHKGLFNILPPSCNNCGGLLKPEFIFFGENIPPDAYRNSFSTAEQSDLVLVIGTTGEIVPASHIPLIAKQNGAKLIEINPEPSNYTNLHTDIFLQGKASEMLDALLKEIER